MEVTVCDKTSNYMDYAANAWEVHTSGLLDILRGVKVVATYAPGTWEYVYLSEDDSDD